MLSWDEFDKEDGEVAAKGNTLRRPLPPPLSTSSTAPVVPPPWKPVRPPLLTPKPSNVPRLPWMPSTLPKAWPSWRVPRPVLQLTKNA